MLDSASGDQLESLIVRRMAGEPLEMLVGWVAFAGERIAVTPGLFVPRRRSELLVRLAIAAAPDGGIVADICCGTGAIGAVVARRRPDLIVVAADVDGDAAACARRNLPVGAAVYVGNLLSPLPDALRGRLDAIVANAPYVPTGQIAMMPREAREHERVGTLDGGGDGLDIQRRLLVQSVDWLTDDGVIIVETSRRQAELSLAAAEASGLRGRIEHDADSDAWAMAATRH